MRSTDEKTENTTGEKTRKQSETRPGTSTSSRQPVPASEERESFTEVAGHTMFARQWSPQETSRPPVVLIHGLVVSSSYFVPTARRIAGDRRVLAPDQTGFGRSDGPHEALSVSDLAAALIEWFRAMQLERATLIANSFGCQVATELAMRRPDLVSRLVLASPTLEPQARTVRRILRRWVKESRTQSPELKRLLVREYVRAGVPRAVGTLRRLLDDRIEDRLPYVDQPTLVVRGTADPICTQPWAQRVADTLPRGRLVTLEGAPHAMNFDAPDQFVEAISAFLDEKEKGE